MVKANIKETIEADVRGELPSRPYPTKKVTTTKPPKEKPKIIMEDISIITEQSKLTKKICPAFGIVETKADSHYYFGTNLTCRVPIKFKGKISYKQDTFLVLIKDNRTKIICHSKNLQDYNYILDETLLLKNSRWDLQHLHKWLADEDCTPKIEPMQPKELFKKIKEQFEFYLDLPEEEWYDYLTLWTIGAYFYSFFIAYPMVYLYGLKNTGKTKIMTLSSYLSFNGSMFVGITPATLFRLVEANKPSLFLDEIEKLLDKKREGSADIEAMLNSGYQKGATVPRC